MGKKIFMIFIIALSCSVFFSLATNLLAAPKAELWAVWNKSVEYNSDTIDHQTWNDFLNKYVVKADTGINLVDYKKAKAEGKKQLNQYIKKLSYIKIRNYNKKEQKAFWINLYNALTVQIVLEHYPVESIRDIDISPGWFSDGPWGKKLIKIEEIKISLDDIEHKILRPIWKDPRVHYAVNCASIGCPDLQIQAFTGENTDKLLNQAAIDYINHSRGVKIKKDLLRISSIYNWFSSDFGETEQQIIIHLMKYSKPDLKDKLSKIKMIYDYKYDWDLNDIKRE